MNNYRFGLTAILTILLTLPGVSMGYHGGIGGTQVNIADGNEISDVAEMGCLCHNPDGSDNSVTVLMADVPYRYLAGETYEMVLQIVGGPAADGVYTAGFSMRVNIGTLAAGSGSESLTQTAVDGDETTLTHTAAGAAIADRSWTVAWTAPDAGAGDVVFRVTGNSVNGDQGATNDDRWNHLMFSIPEAGAEEDTTRTRTIFVGDGELEAPQTAEHGLSLHDMGAPLRAHWLGLLGFLSVILVIFFCGLMLRYGFSTSYKGRSNLLRLRYHTERRGDQ